MDVRLCTQGCGARLHMRNTSGECEACSLKCPTCGGVKAAQSRQCRKCAGTGRQPGIPQAPIPRPPVLPEGTEPSDAPPALRDEFAAALTAPPSRAEMPPAVVVLPDPAPPPTESVPRPLTLQELPDYVGSLLGQIDRLLARVQEQDAELNEFRKRERAWLDVERRVQAVIARTRR